MALDFTTAPYTTGDTAVGMISYRLSFPNEYWYLLAVMGALCTLCEIENWNTVGLISPTDAASYATAMVQDFAPMVIQVGMIVPYGGSVAPDGALLCDGASYLRDDYADLFAVIGTNFGAVDSSHFNVPDLRGRAGVGAGTGTGLSPRAIGQSFGEETHTLTGAEVPSHSHTDSGHVHSESAASPTLIAIGAGVPAPSATPLPSFTGSGSSNLDSFGGGGDHNNIQPSLVVQYIILTR